MILDIIFSLHLVSSLSRLVMCRFSLSSLSFSVSRWSFPHRSICRMEPASSTGQTFHHRPRIFVPAACHPVWTHPISISRMTHNFTIPCCSNNDRRLAPSGGRWAPRCLTWTLTPGDLWPKPRTDRWVAGGDHLGAGPRPQCHQSPPAQPAPPPPRWTTARFQNHHAARAGDPPDRAPPDPYSTPSSVRRRCSWRRSRPRPVPPWTAWPFCSSGIASRRRDKIWAPTANRWVTDPGLRSHKSPHLRVFRIVFALVKNNIKRGSITLIICLFYYFYS